MARCDRCGAFENMPYKCNHCGGVFCADHRLPEKHDCPGLENWNDPTGVFDSGFDDSVRHPEGRRGGSRRSVAEGTMRRIGLDTGTGGPLAYVRNNVTYVLLLLIWATFALQWIVRLGFGPEVHNAIFVLRSDNLLFLWTWVTSVFAHDPFNLFHILFNSIVLYFFGPIVERKVGSKMFAVLFLGAGIAAGVSQVALAAALGGSGAVLGASGGILAIMGVLTVLNPHLRILLFFIIPMPLWLLTLGFAVFSVFVMVGAGIGAGGIAHLAHLIGLVIGLLYGEKLRREGTRVPDQLRFGGGPGGGMGGPGRRRF